MSILKYDTIESDAMIDIQVSGHFYKRIVNALLALGESRSSEEFKEALEALKTDNPPKDAYEVHIRLFMALISEIETKAKAQNKTKHIEVDTNDLPKS